MIAFLLGLGLLVLLLFAADAFSRATVASIKRLLAWIAALGGLSLAAIMLLSGRAGGAVAAGMFAAPLAWSWWLESRRPYRRAPPPGGPPPGGSRPGGSRPGGSRPAGSGSGRMSRAEALSVLGLAEGASEKDIREAYRRLMMAVHPDRGGSAWLAARLNQARSVLLVK